MKILPYPEKPNPILPGMPSVLSFALDGLFTPDIVVVDENILADDLSLAIGDEIDLLDVQKSYDIIYDIDKEPFRFTVDLSFEVYTLNGYYMVEITKIAILASWGKDREGFSIELPVKYSKESLIAILENQIRILV